ncbi:MAG: exodeoxyribonuclease V subunit gamma [Eubacteriales bacterium]|nr:exodeoxyribonuclease V subunit gamma [Eubacteriales bacterium]
MLHLFYARENIDKDKFLYERVGEVLNQASENEHQKILLLVPDQFTLQAERNAFDYLGTDGLIDFEVMSQSRLGFKVLSETGGTNRTTVDKYGRHMLLAKILTEEDDHLEVFSGMNQKSSFIEMTNNLISEMKQFNTYPEDLRRILDETGENPILNRKLKDIHKIYEKYEDLIAGKYLDTEDHLNLFTEKIRHSRVIQNAVIWISGFDYLTPKTLDIVEQLMLTAKDVNIILTADHTYELQNVGKPSESRDHDLFDLTRSLMKKLKSISERNGIKYEEKYVDKSCITYTAKRSEKCESKHCGKLEEKAEALAHLEHEIFAQPYRQGTARNAIMLCQAANFYSEAETAAAKIIQLIRDEGLRYRDILVVCNDMETRASIIKRVFADYGITAFLDKKRDILHHPSVEFIASLLDITAKGWRYEDIFRMLKTNLTPISPDECEDLENYAVKYRIKGNRWKKDFTYGIKAEGEDALFRINEIRKRVYDYLTVFEKEFKQAENVREKTAAIYDFLKDKAQLPERIEDLIEYLVKEGQLEYAEEAAQIWGVMIAIFDQLVELIGEEKISPEEYGIILKSGLEAVEIGLLPPAADQILVGTMQRTRTGKIKALIIIGANDGLLPTASESESLLNEDEKTALYNKGIEICKIDDLRTKEEKLAIYKTLSKPTLCLWMSYSTSDLEGRESKQSILFDKIRKIFPDLKVLKDILNAGDPLFLIETPGSTLKHMTEAFRNAMDGNPLDEKWGAVYKWYLNNHSSQPIKAVKEGLFFDNKQEKMNKDLVWKLYKRDPSLMLSLSPSRLERFSRCPFSHFINYGLRPDERRIFEIGGREIGDVYHQCFMKLSEALSIPGMEITDPESPWMKITKEQCQQMIDDFIEEAAMEYRDGVLIQGEEELYRGQRMKKVSGEAAWALIEHVKSGQIQNIFFESEFGKASGKQFPPIEVKLGEQTVYIEGKIDRVDVLKDIKDPDSRYIKIIDYKSGKEKFDTDEAKCGWKLQLMLYLSAALGAGSPEKYKDNLYKPAGVFYFEIAEPLIDVTRIPEEEYLERVKTERKKSFKLDGVVIDDQGIIESIAGEFSGYSDILPVKNTKEGYVGTTDKKILSEGDFSELINSVSSKVRELCIELSEGHIDIKPKKVKDETACRFCLYKSICCFDLSFEGCSYDVVK